MRGWSQWACVVIISFALVSVCATVSQARIYTWTDETGVQHFSDQPPPRRSISTIRPESTKPGVDESEAGQGPAASSSERPSAARGQHLPTSLLPLISGVY